MTDNWSTCKLREVADVRVSNVDKKTHKAETPIKLCNYMDVYANDYVSASIDFMAASASKSEIDRFGLQTGDVVITKDSETPDDIGVPTVITDSIDGLVCGYHLALIRPRNRAIDAIYLAKQISSAPIARYFALNASGSTRFGLPVGVIEDTRIPVAPKPEQTKIAEILSTVDQAIEQTEALIAKQQRIKTGLMHDLLTRGIDEEGNLRSEDTHEFKDSPIGRIPLGWKVKTVGTLASRVTKGESPTWQGFKYHEDGILFVTSENVRTGFLDITKSEKFVSDAFHRKLKRSALRHGDILVNLVGASIARSAVYDLNRDANINQAVCSVRLSDEMEPLWLCEYLQLPKNIERLLGEQVETARANLSLGDIRSYLVPYPPYVEQLEIIKLIKSLRNKHQFQLSSLKKLRSLKAALMQDLLTGEVPVTPLLIEADIRQ